jgi:ACR3 family arsenite efflux pump ArsB
MSVLRRIGAVIAGMIVAFLIVQAAEWIAHMMYPPPARISWNDLAQVKAYVTSLPLSALLVVLTGWLIATVVATWVAARIAGRPIPGYIVGALLLCAGIANAFMIPQPVWFSIASFVIYIAATWVGARAGAPARVASA